VALDNSEQRATAVMAIGATCLVGYRTKGAQTESQPHFASVAQRGAAFVRDQRTSASPPRTTLSDIKSATALMADETSVGYTRIRGDLRASATKAGNTI